MGAVPERSTPTPTLPVEDAAAIGEAVGAALLGERKPFLVLVTGGDAGTRYRVGDGMRIGRDPECEIVLGDAQASWHHARIEVRGSEVWVVDQGSTNGTLLGAQRIDRTKLGAGDKLVIGGTVLRFDLLDALDCELQAELERLLDIDELTGLPAKRKFDAEGRLLVRAAVEQGRPIAALMMDLDGVKKINDTHGHAFGAYTIAESGRIIGAVIGERGIATRWGGDEFSAILPDHGADAARAIAEEILAAIRDHHYQREHVRLHPGISIGLVEGPRGGDTLESLQRWADEALYRAKRTGRGRVCVI
jgi:diguanylate cyclase (GGDEF)-like protein